jgi:hypothetical protein
LGEKIFKGKQIAKMAFFRKKGSAIPLKARLFAIKIRLGFNEKNIL